MYVVCRLTPNTTKLSAEFLLICPVSLSMVSIWVRGYAAQVILPKHKIRRCTNSLLTNHKEASNNQVYANNWSLVYVYVLIYVFGCNLKYNMLSIHLRTCWI